ncbi:hypothetical protein [Polaromonas sp. JS666]|uniref:hypothetical protein n=1 Tax=Polaromonas sp. (strain JS666 / ATCC BAA-500) TaxID=296591 RepID=UPI0002FAC797|nr:hypothetical protein [Polaromonas sp. JS666]
MTTPTERARTLRWAGEFIQTPVVAGDFSEKCTLPLRFPCARETNLNLQMVIERHDVKDGLFPGIEVPAKFSV